MKGIFSLRTPADLFAKLESDLRRLRDNSTDEHAAFDFFVTAWHLIDWKFPNTQDPARLAMLARLPILRVCEHLAVGAKHFHPSSSRHVSVKDSRRAGAWSRYVGPGTWAIKAWEELTVELDGDARNALGDSINVVDLAERVVNTWRTEIQTSRFDC